MKAARVCSLLVLLAVTVPFGDGAPVPVQEGSTEVAAEEGHEGVQELQREYEVASKVIQIAVGVDARLQTLASATAVANGRVASAKAIIEEAGQAEELKQAAQKLQESTASQVPRLPRKLSSGVQMARDEKELKESSAAQASTQSEVTSLKQLIATTGATVKSAATENQEMAVRAPWDES